MSGGTTWPGYAAALWAAVFTVLHIVWATGWYVGLDRELARRAFQQRWFLIYDLIVAGVCAVGAWVALALVKPWGSRMPRRLILTLAWCGTGLLAIRGGAGTLQTLHQIAKGGHVKLVFWSWDVWFCVGAILFGFGSWRFSQREEHGPTAK